MSDPTLSDIDFKNKMVWTTLKKFEATYYLSWVFFKKELAT